MSATPSSTAEQPTRRNSVWWTIQYLLQLVFTGWLRYRARGIDRLPLTGGGLILSNHQSFLDPLLIGLPLTRPVSFLARDSLFRVPGVGWVLRNTYVMPLNREGGAAAGIKETLRRLEAGYLVGIFPEGTRSVDGQLGELKPGFAALLRRSKQPVYPVGIAGAVHALNRRQAWLSPARVCVVFGQPLDPVRLAALTERGRETELVAFVREAIRDCLAEAEAWRLGVEPVPSRDFTDHENDSGVPKMSERR